MKFTCARFETIGVSVKLDGIQLDGVAHLLQPSHRPTVVLLRNVYQYKHMYIFYKPYSNTCDLPNLLDRCGTVVLNDGLV